MEGEFISGIKVANIMVNGKITKFMDKGNMNGQMEGYSSHLYSPIMVVGSTIKCTEEESIFGKMESVMMGNINAIRSKALVFFTGLMENNTRVIGWMENNREKE